MAQLYFDAGGPYADKRELLAVYKADGLRKIMRRATLVAKPQPGMRPMVVESRRAAREDSGRVYFARHLADKLTQQGVLRGPALAAAGYVAPAVRAVDAGPPAAALFDYQAAAVEHFAKALRDGGCGYLRMATGTGKTRAGVALAAALGGPTLVVVPTQAIAAQWVEEASLLHPRLRATIYANRARNKPGPESHDLVVVVVNTFRAKEPDFVAGYRLVLLDEAHEYISPCNQEALWLAQSAPCVLGLSATPLERLDGLDRYVTYHIGPPVDPGQITGRDGGTRIEYACAARVIYYYGDPEYARTVHVNGTASHTLTVDASSRDPCRLRAVAAETARLCRLHEAPGAAERGLGPRPPERQREGFPAGEVRRHCVLVFAEHRSYLDSLRDALNADYGVVAVIEDSPEDHAEDTSEEVDEMPEDVPDIGDVQILRGGVSQNEVAQARHADTRVILATYGFARRGVSITQVTAIVLATSRKTGMSQILGRMFRKGSDADIQRELVDFVDRRTMLASQYYSRAKVYKALGFSIERVTMHADPAAEPAADPAAEPAADPADPDPEADIDRIKEMLQLLSD